MMLHAARLQHVLDALKTAAEASSGEPDPQIRTALIEAGVEQLLAEISGAEGADQNLPEKASQVLGLFEKIGLPEDQSALMGQVILGIGKTYERMGNNPQAYESYTQALSLVNQTGDLPAQAGCLRRIGRVLVGMARWVEAKENLDSAIELYDSAGDRKGRAAVLLDMGTLYYRQGDLDEAEARYNEALEIAEDENDVSLKINARNNMGIVANIRGDTDQAIAHYRSCVPLAEQPGMEPHAARAQHNLGKAYAARQHWQQAGDCYERGLRIAREQSMGQLVGVFHLNRSEMYLELSDIDMAAVSCGRALNVFTSSQNRLGEAKVYQVLGGIFARRADEITAMEMFKRSLEITQDVPAPLEIAETFYAMGMAYERLGNVPEAISAIEQAVTHFEQVHAEADRTRAEQDLARLRK
jgi:tetratricopeptide (TPR) repeat protein